MTEVSTTIDTDPGPSAGGAGVPKIAEPTTIPTTRDDLDAALKEMDAGKDGPKDEAKADPKAGDDKAKADDDKSGDKPDAAKVEQKEPDKREADKEKDGEAKAEATDDAKVKQDDAKEGKSRHPDAPANFLPRAKELWRNTPNEVKAEVNRVIAEAEQAQESYKRYDDLREFDELAKSNGRDLKESLTKLNQIENMMQQNPIAALNAILAEVGPRKADGQPLSMIEVASYIAQQGQQGYQQIVQRGAQQQQQAQGNDEINALKRQIAQMQAQGAAREIIEPFAAKNPRYKELEPDIAFFLASGKIPQSLSPSERLAAAYDMAVRINPASNAGPATTDEPASDRRADNDFGGSTKSIKSSPGSVSEDVDSVAASGESIEDSIRKELRRMRA